MIIEDIKGKIQMLILLYVLGYYTTTVSETKYNFVYILTNTKNIGFSQSLFLCKNYLE